MVFNCYRYVKPTPTGYQYSHTKNVVYFCIYSVDICAKHTKWVLQEIAATSIRIETKVNKQVYYITA